MFIRPKEEKGTLNERFVNNLKEEFNNFDFKNTEFALRNEVKKLLETP